MDNIYTFSYQVRYGDSKTTTSITDIPAMSERLAVTLAHIWLMDTYPGANIVSCVDITRYALLISWPESEYERLSGIVDSTPFHPQWSLKQANPARYVLFTSDRLDALMRQLDLYNVMYVKVLTRNWE